MIRRRLSKVSREPRLSAQFGTRIQERLELADGRRHRRAALQRWRWVGILSIPVVCALSWAVLPLTFADGVRALIGATGYITTLLAVAQAIGHSYLSFLGLSSAPVAIDVLLLIGVVSWLMWASSSAKRQTTVFDGIEP